MARCHECGRESADGQTFCGECGTRLPRPRPDAGTARTAVSDSILNRSPVDTRQTNVEASVGPISINVGMTPPTQVLPVAATDDSEPRQSSHRGRPEAGINPYYEEDLLQLDGCWDLAHVITAETVFVVTGCNVLSELLDRPVAGLLRDQIDRLGAGQLGRRAIVIGDVCWGADWDGGLTSHPMICIGGPPIAGEVASAGDCWHHGEMHGARIAGPPERVALWGGTATQTRASVVRYIQDEGGLRAFLRRAWSGWSPTRGQ